jgi:multisubunit Na+/H+ antiporter MnhC subunit
MLSLAITALVAGVLLFGIGGFSNPPRRTLDPTVHDIGTKLMTTHVVPLEIAALLLTAATIGAVVLALHDGSSVRASSNGDATQPGRPESAPLSEAKMIPPPHEEALH